MKARQQLVATMADSTLAVLQDQKKPLEQRADALQQGFAKMVDIDWIAKFVAGNAWREASEDERAKFTTLYRAYLTKNYIATFGQSRDRRITDIKILGLVDNGEDSFTARTELQLSDSEHVKVDYRVRETPGHNKIVDIIIENVSMLATHRAEFAQIGNGGMPAIIAKLESRLSKDEIELSMK
jgi:phospholipid transport system substrate-binding protein